MTTRNLRHVQMLSPYSGDIKLNLIYARMCMEDCFMHGEAPFAPHMLYPGILDESIPSERALGIEAGIAIGKKAHGIIVYRDLGISPGMEWEIAAFERHNVRIEYRNIMTYEKDSRVSRGGYPTRAQFEANRLALEKYLPWWERRLRAFKRINWRDAFGLS